MIIGAIIGDIVGSRFEWLNIKSKEFTFWRKRCKYTDDTVMTLAIAAICGSAAGPFYSVPAAHRDTAMSYLPPQLQSIISRFNEKYGN